MTRFTLCFAATGGALLATPAFAQAPAAPAFRLTANTRIRYEFIENQVRPGFNRDEAIIDVRTIVGGEANLGRLRLGAEVWDSRAYDADARSAISTNEVNALEVVQAYARYDIGPVFGRGSDLAVQAGRFILNLGSRRLVAADDFRNTTNGYTGVRADVRLNGGANASFIYTLPQQRLPSDLAGLLDNRVEVDRESFASVLWGVIGARPNTVGRATAEAAYFRFVEHDEPGVATRDRDLHNLTARLIREPAAGAIDWEAEAIYQFGSAGSSTAAGAPVQDVSASFVHADIGYTWRGPLTLRTSIEYDRASGDGPGSTYGRFDTLFGMRRAELAPSGLYGSVGRANIATPGARIEVAPGTRFDAFAVYRAMWAADGRDSFSTSNIRDASGASGSFAGHQLEGRLRYWLVPRHVRLEANAVWLLRGRLLEDAPNATPGRNTLYCAFQTSFSF